MAAERLRLHPVVVTSLFMVTLVSVMMTSVKSRDVSDSHRLTLDKWRLSRRSYCVGSAGKCFSSGQCCDGLICAAFDDYFGQKPEVPGYCVKEKDLQVCAANVDCQSGSRCVSLGRTGERYCLPRSEVKNLIQQQAMEELDQPQVLKQLGGGDGKLSGLGAQCESSAECKPVTDVTQAQLCCQDVRRGRQGVRRICDRITTISVCIP